MLTYLAKITVKSSIQKQNRTRQKKFLVWDKIERIALLLDNEASINKNLLDKFIQKTNKHVEVYHIDLKAKEAIYADWHCFLKKDQTLLKLPKSNLMANLRSKKFDVVINTSTKCHLYSTSVLSNLNAHVKCGNEEHFDDLDLIIKKTEPFDLINYLEDVVKYLKMIRPAC